MHGDSINTLSHGAQPVVCAQLCMRLLRVDIGPKKDAESDFFGAVVEILCEQSHFGPRSAPNPPKRPPAYLGYQSRYLDKFFFNLMFFRLSKNFEHHSK